MVGTEGNGNQGAAYISTQISNATPHSPMHEYLECFPHNPTEGPNFPHTTS